MPAPAVVSVSLFARRVGLNSACVTLASTLDFQGADPDGYIDYTTCREGLSSIRTFFHAAIRVADATSAFALTPHGRLTLDSSEAERSLVPERAGALARAFERGAGHGLLDLGGKEVGTLLPPEYHYWRELAA